MDKTIAIHQPEHLCHLGLIDQISKSDIFVIFDTVQVKKIYYDNRNKIRTKEGWQWITVPISKDNHRPFNEVEIIYDGKWQKKYLGSIYNAYHNSPYFHAYYPTIKNIITEKISQNICIGDLNIDLLTTFLQWFGINKEIIYSSDLGISDKLTGSDKCLEICKKLNATTYLSGISGKNYLNLEKFKEANIEVDFHEFLHPVYKQVFEPFIPGMSALDLLFNYGNNAKEIIKGKGIGALELILNKIDYEDRTILEMFGGDGSGELSCYANSCSNLHIWELNIDNFEILCKKFTKATKINADSLQEMKKERWHNYFDILIIDPPATMSINSILPEALKLLKNEGIVIFRTIKKSYNNNPQVQPDLSLEEWNTIIYYSGYDIINSYEQVREFYLNEHWLSNFVYELERR